MRRCSHAPQARFLCLLACFTVVISTPAIAQKTDVVLLTNGDRVTGEVKQLLRAKLKLDTDPMGVVSISWQDVQHVTSDELFEIELSSGERYLGVVQPSTRDGYITLDLDAGPAEVRRDAIVRLTPIKESFWSRFDGSVDLGVSYLQQNHQFDYTLGAKVKYVEANYSVTLDVNSLLRFQDSVSNTNRQDATLSYARSFGEEGWFWTALGAVESNAELSLDARGTVGAGIGSFFIETNRFRFATWAGAGYIRERYVDQSAGNAGAGIVELLFEFFTEAERDTDISASFYTLPVFTQAGRVRLEGNAVAKQELFKDFFFKFRIFGSYDSQPPTAGETNKSDFGVTTSLGWTF